MKQGKSTKIKAMSAALIAPCGMNCRLCRAFVREKNACPGCRGEDSLKPKTRILCRIKTCGKIVRGGARYCFCCAGFPCDRLNSLDKRYRTRYGMSMIDNLRNIRKSGIRRFLENEKKRWACPECGETICVHEPQCLSCGRRWR